MTRPARPPDSPFWVRPGDVDLAGSRLTLDADESHHLLHVFRGAAGTPFEAIDGIGSLYRCVLEGREGTSAVGRIESRVENFGELPWELGLIVGLPDMAQAESVVEHAVPLGATSIDFAVTARSGREPFSESRLERLGRVNRSALKQARRTRLPKITSSETLEIALATISPQADLRLFADSAGEPGISMSETPTNSAQCTVSMVVGPPGGLIEWERGVLRGASYTAISLGPSRLSTSTAAICLLASARNFLLSTGLYRVDKTGLSGYLS